MVISTAEYNEICASIEQLKGLSMECEGVLQQQFPHIDSGVLNAILAKDWQQRIKSNYPRIAANCRRFLQE